MSQGSIIPCVDYIFVRRAGQRDLLSERCASPSLPCPALHCTRLAESLCAPPPASPCAGHHLGAFYTHNNIRVPPGAAFYALSLGVLGFFLKMASSKTHAVSLWLDALWLSGGWVCPGAVFGFVCIIFGIVTTVVCVVVVIYELGEGCDKNPCSFSWFSALIR